MPAPEYAKTPDSGQPAPTLRNQNRNLKKEVLVVGTNYRCAFTKLSRGKAIYLVRIVALVTGSRGAEAQCYIYLLYFVNVANLKPICGRDFLWGNPRVYAFFISRGSGSNRACSSSGLQAGTAHEQTGVERQALPLREAGQCPHHGWAKSGEAHPRASIQRPLFQ